MYSRQFAAYLILVLNKYYQKIASLSAKFSIFAAAFNHRIKNNK